MSAPSITARFIVFRYHAVRLGKRGAAFLHRFPEANLVRPGNTRVENPAEYSLGHDAAADECDLHSL